MWLFPLCQAKVDVPEEGVTVFQVVLLLLAMVIVIYFPAVGPRWTYLRRASPSSR